MRQREADLTAFGSDEEEEIERLYTIDEDGRAPWKVSSPPSSSHQQLHSPPPRVSCVSCGADQCCAQNALFCVAGHAAAQ
jgi:hypothetical protein